MWPKPLDDPETINSFRHYRAKVASLTRNRPPGDPELAAARIGMLAFSKSANRVDELTSIVRAVIGVDSPLTPQERSQVIRAISGAGNDSTPVSSAL